MRSARDVEPARFAIHLQVVPESFAADLIFFQQMVARAFGAGRCCRERHTCEAQNPQKHCDAILRHTTPPIWLGCPLALERCRVARLPSSRQLSLTPDVSGLKS